MFYGIMTTANSAIFGDKQMLGRSVLQTPALVLSVCRVRLISFSGVTWVKSLEKNTRKFC